MTPRAVIVIEIRDMSGTSTRTERLTIRVPRELLAQLRAQAVRDGVSVAAVVLRELGCTKIDGKCTKIDAK